MKRVTGIGGIFFKCDDTKKMQKWYQKHLGINITDSGAIFEWREKDNPKKIGQSVLSFFAKKTKYFKPSKKQFMINFRVENLDALIKQLKKEKVLIPKEMEVYDFGKFAWIMDPEGNKIELWEPTD
jgi:predicted enzyme related to lactoylglutathione lyase